MTANGDNNEGSANQHAVFLHAAVSKRQFNAKARGNKPLDL